MERLPPAALCVRLAPGVLVREGGRVLVGGQPTRMVRLAPAGAALAAAWTDGTRVGETPSARQLARRLLDAGLLIADVEPRVRLAAIEIVVPARDRAAELERCLAALADAAPVLVVDDASADPAAIARVAHAHGARVLRRPARGGPGAARNSGLAATSAEFIAFVDSDVVVSPGWLHRLAAGFDDPGVGAVAPRVRALAADGPGVAAYEARHSALDMGPRPARVHPRGTVPYVPSTALVVRRSAVAAGGFDAALQVGEDVDFVWRMLAAGWGVAYDPAAEVRHAHRTEPQAFLLRRWQYAVSIGELARRHPESLAPLRIAPEPALAAVALALGRPRVAAAAVAAHLVRTHRTLTATSPGSLLLTAELSARSYGSVSLAAARAVRRVWSPALLLLAPRSAVARRLLLAAAALALAGEDRPALRHLPIAVADDLVAAAGTWAGSLRVRTSRAVLPGRA
jgi:mycofactocin system glycosyltransferase